MTGVERIRAVFQQKRAGKEAAFMPYHPMGFPDRERSIAIVEALAAEGADLFEIGIPFSDPLADGPTVQDATYQALLGGTTVADCFAMVATLRRRGVTQPFCAMSYYNPILAYGEKRFVDMAVTTGIDGLIVPDMPPGESADLEEQCRLAGIATIYMLAPTSTTARIAAVARQATGFIYLVSIAGITGARDSVPADLVHFVQRVRRETDLPLAVGFGIANRQHAAQVAAIADGVIVGSALVKQAGSENGLVGVRSLARELIEGSRHPTVPIG